MTRICDLVPWDEIVLPRAPWDDADCHNPSILRVPDGAHAHAGAWLCNIRATSYPANCRVVDHWPGRPGFRSHHEADRSASPARSHCSHTRNWLWTLDADQRWATIAGREIVHVEGARPSCSYNYVGYEDLRLAWSPAEGLVASGTTLMHNQRGVFEIVVVDLDRDYRIDRATAVRGWWSDDCQKNWAPYLGLPVSRWLHSPSGGGVVDRAGGGAPAPRAFSPSLCGGTQLVPIGEDRFLGLGHSYDPLDGGGRLYWHRAFVVTAAGEVVARSRPFKLSEHDVDFACGLAVDPRRPDRAVVTFGVANRESRLAETSLGALVALVALAAPGRDKT